MSQSEDILDYVRCGHSITLAEAYQKFGCQALSQRWTDLKNDPKLNVIYDFHSELIEVIGMGGKVKHVAKYWITRKAEAQLELIPK